MIISAGVNTGPGWIRCFRCLINCGKKLIKLFSSFFIPGFIKRTPSNNRRMVKITVNLFQPLWKDSVNAVCIRVIQSPVGILSPDDIPQPVTVIQETLFKYFFMKAGTVKSHCQGSFYILFQFFIRRCCVNSIRIKALIQNETLKYRFSVEQKLFVCKLYGAQSKITCHLIFSIA